ncbi:MAG: RNA 2',3'-cyclic phosphodiesterase [Desulfobacteraceae bacterium]|nr:RNA 2',3'-cyclic phosphodiesterase [Desulfobacteraceae bacterium]
MSGSSEQMRVFIALFLPEYIRLFLKKLQTDIKSQGFKASWPRVGNMHLTLKFLGNMDINEISTITSTMSEAANDCSKVTLKAAGIGLFPSIKKARIIWSGIQGQTDVLQNNHTVLEKLLEINGFKKEKKRFHPHFTLARLKKPISPKVLVKLIQQYQNYQSEDFNVESMGLYQSDLTSSGAVYTKLFEVDYLK